MIVSLQDEIKKLKQSILEPPTPTASLLDTERIIQEISDREQRKANILIFGSDEIACSTNAVQIATDVRMVNDICLTLNIQDTHFKVSRLGKFDATLPDRRRPIKVSFSSESSVYTILRNISKLRELSKFSKLSIYRDRTPMQVQIYKNAKAELTDRISKGETNLKIVYKKGIPTVVNSLN